MNRLFFALLVVSAVAYPRPIKDSETQGGPYRRFAMWDKDLAFHVENGRVYVKGGRGVK